MSPSREFETLHEESPGRGVAHAVRCGSATKEEHYRAPVGLFDDAEQAKAWLARQ